MNLRATACKRLSLGSSRGCRATRYAAHPVTQWTRSRGNIAVAMFSPVPFELAEPGVPIPTLLFIRGPGSCPRVPRFPAEADAVQAFGAFRREIGLSKRLPLSVNLSRRNVMTSRIRSGLEAIERKGLGCSPSSPMYHPIAWKRCSRRV